MAVGADTRLNVSFQHIPIVFTNEQNVKGGQSDEQVRSIIAGDEVGCTLGLSGTLGLIEREHSLVVETHRLQEARPPFPELRRIGLRRPIHRRGVDEGRIFIQLLSRCRLPRTAHRTRPRHSQTLMLFEAESR